MPDSAPPSISFDRAVEFYDRTRSLPADVAERQTEILLAALGSRVARRPILEIGAGTGRIALPLMRRGVDVFGVDISAGMLHTFRDHAHDDGMSDRARYMQADAVALPLSDSSVPAVIACHVFHLIGDWRRAFGEVIRVLEPGGVLLVSRGGWGRWRRKVASWFHEAARSQLAVRGAGDVDDIEEAAAAAGLATERLPDITTTREVDLRIYVDELTAGLYSGQWHLTESQREAAGEVTHQRLVDERGEETVVEDQQTITWAMCTKP